MREYAVWKAAITFIQDNQWYVDAACPPGGTCFAGSRCCFMHPVTGKQDEPDIMFRTSQSIVLVECKGTYSGIINNKLKDSGESDIDKLRRLKRDFEKGDYAGQLEKNYGIKQEDYSIEICIAYGGKVVSNRSLSQDIAELVVTQDGQVLYRNRLF